jgi:hypothetical protein
MGFMAKMLKINFSPQKPDFFQVLWFSHISLPSINATHLTWLL